MKKIKFLVVALLSMLVLSACGAKKVDLTDYVMVTYQGLNGRADANVGISYGELEDIVLQSGNVSLMQLVLLEDSIKCTADKTENLQNGDSITVSITWDEKLAKECGLKFTGKETKVTVAGLEEGKEVDLFQDIEIDFKGVSPEASASIRNTSKDSFLSSISYSLDRSFDLENGDEITVTANCTEEWAESKGYIINETEKTFVVEGVDEYITEYSKIDQSTLDKLDSQARDVIEAKLVDWLEYTGIMYPDEFVYSASYQETVEIKPVYHYFFCLKDGLSSNEFGGQYRNSLFAVYEVTTKDTHSPDGVTAYVSVYFHDFIMRDTGLDVEVTNTRVKSYGNYDNMFRKIVTANKDNYTYEEINLQQN